MRRKRTCDGRGFPPGLETVGEVHVKFFGVKDGIDVAAGNVEYAAGAALGVGPGDVDAVVGEKAGESVGMLDRGDLVLTESESGFFAAITDAIGTEKEITDVPVGVALVDTRSSRWRKADVDAAPGVGLNALGSEFFVERGEEIAASETRGVVGQEEESKERDRKSESEDGPFCGRGKMDGDEREQRGNEGEKTDENEAEPESDVPGALSRV